MNLRNADAMKRKKRIVSHRRSNLAAALEAFGAAFATLLANETTAESGQAISKVRLGKR